MIDFKRVRHAARPSKDLRTRASSEAQPVRPNTATIGPRNDLTGILVCRRSTGFTDTFGCHRQSMTRPSPPGLDRSANCAWRAPVLQTVQGYRHRASSEAHPSVSRTLTECLRALTGTSGFHRTPPGVHRRSIPHGRDFRDPIARPAAARTTSVVHRTTSVAHQVRHLPRASSDAHRNLRVPPESLRRLEASSSKLAVQRR